jgi:tetrahydromethanopterin S-methyltransferase subunit G
VNTQAHRISFHPGIASRSDATVPGALVDSAPAIDVQELERQVEYIVDECFFTVGQVVGMRTTVDYEAVIWWRDHYRAKFLSAMKAFGNRWRQDRANVTSSHHARRAGGPLLGRETIDRRRGRAQGGG